MLSCVVCSLEKLLFVVVFPFVNVMFVFSLQTTAASFASFFHMTVRIFILHSYLFLVWSVFVCFCLYAITYKVFVCCLLFEVLPYVMYCVVFMLDSFYVSLLFLFVVFMLCVVFLLKNCCLSLLSFKLL